MINIQIAFRTAAVAAAMILGTFAMESVKAADSVSLITDFGFNGRHAYFFVALDKGYYKDAGLDVKIIGGKGSVDAIRQVGAGNATFGFEDTGSLVLSRANDNIPVKTVEVVYARPPQAIFCSAEAGLKTPKDLEGKSIANPAGGSIPDMFPAFAKAAGIDARKVNWVVVASSALPGLLASGKMPCVGQFTVGQPLLRAQAAPKKLVRFAYSDPGLSYYGNGIIATEETIKSNPDLVRRFVAATIKGLKSAIANPAEAGAIIHKHHPEVDAEVAKGETEAVADLAEVKGKPLAELDQSRVQATIDVVNGAFKLKSQVNAGDIYVLGFVPK
jgi:NitT/TauT family transport system substrate-binding protein